MARETMICDYSYTETVKIDHGAYQERTREMSDAALLFTIKDASGAIEAMPHGPKVGYYTDEIHYCAMELKRRQDDPDSPVVG